MAHSREPPANCQCSLEACAKWIICKSSDGLRSVLSSNAQTSLKNRAAKAWWVSGANSVILAPAAMGSDPSCRPRSSKSSTPAGTIWVRFFAESPAIPASSRLFIIFCRISPAYAACSTPNPSLYTPRSRTRLSHCRQPCWFSLGSGMDAATWVRSATSPKKR